MTNPNSPTLKPMTPKPDEGHIRRDLVSEAEYDKRCMHYTEWAFYCPPDRFVFRYFEDPEDLACFCERPMPMEKYVATRVKDGAFCGIYDTRDIGKYIKTGTWILLNSREQYAKRDIADLETKLAARKEELAGILKRAADGLPEEDEPMKAWNFVKG